MFPVLFSSSWTVLYAYPLFMGVAVGVGVKLSLFLIESYGEPPLLSKTLLFISILFAWIGAKIFFLIYSAGELVEVYAKTSSFWLGGGFVFFGGFIFGAMPIIYSAFYKKNFNHQNIPLLLPALCIAHGIGRIGCLLAGCCYGKVTSSFFSIHLHGEYRYPVQIYESISLLILGLILIKLIKKRYLSVVITSIYLVSYGVIRFILEFLRGDSIRGIHLFGLSTSQFISMGFFGIGILLILNNYFSFRKKERHHAS